MECIFCRIRDKKIEQALIYEDDKCLVFPDKYPVESGHLLIVSRIHQPHFFDLSDEIFTHMTRLAQKFGKILEKQYKPLKVGLAIFGLQVSHTHIHLVPVYPSNTLAAKYEFINKTGLSNEEMESISESIKLRL